MPNFRETRACLAYAVIRNKFFNKKEFALLYDVHKSTNPEFPYWNYERFDLDEKTNTEYMAEFDFTAKAIMNLLSRCSYLKR